MAFCRLKMCVATWEPQSFERRSLKHVRFSIYIDLSWKVAAWTRVAEGGGNKASWRPRNIIIRNNMKKKNRLRLVAFQRDENHWALIVILFLFFFLAFSILCPLFLFLILTYIFINFFVFSKPFHLFFYHTSLSFPPLSSSFSKSPLSRQQWLWLVSIMHRHE